MEVRHVTRASSLEYMHAEAPLATLALEVDSVVSACVCDRMRVYVCVAIP